MNHYLGKFNNSLQATHEDTFNETESLNKNVIKVVT